MAGRPDDSADSGPGIRLQKVLAAAGVASRRKCEELIAKGRVTVDGEVVRELGVRVDPERQEVLLDFEPVRPERKVYFLVNKPKGTVSTHVDPAGRKRVVDLVPPQAGRMFTVGRLDENTEGLILVTNDGELANRLAHPRYQVPRIYKAQVAGIPTREVIDELQKGVYFPEGKFRIDRIRKVAARGNSSVLELTLTEGKNREIRRLFARAGHKVMSLQRIAFGPLKLAKLRTGEYRQLSGAELRQLRDIPRSGSPARPRRKGTKSAPQKAAGKRPATKAAPKRTGKRRSPKR